MDIFKECLPGLRLMVRLLSSRIPRLQVTGVAFLLMVLATKTHAQIGAAGSLLARNPDNLQRVLLAPMEPGDPLRAGGWRMDNLRVETALDVPPKLGQAALRLRGDAAMAGSKGDFTVHEQISGQTDALGLWVWLDEEANVQRLGIQAYDAQSEALMMLVPADWRGWKWIEFRTRGEHVEPSYPQADKNGRMDFPLKSVNVVWFTQAPGATHLIVDGMAALVDQGTAEGEAAVTFSLSAPVNLSRETPLSGSVLAVNNTDEPVEADLAYSLQQDSSLYAKPLPDPVEGSNHAPGLKSWAVADEKIIENSSLTDGLPWTDAGTDYKTGHFNEAFQYVELGQARRITKMSWLSGDANHTWYVDVAASPDGKVFSPVPGLQKVDQHKKWGWSDYPLTSSFDARVIRFRYHTGDPQKKEHQIRFPSELAVYDGVKDEVLALPQVGRVLDQGHVQVTVPARSFRWVELPLQKTPGAGAFLLGVDAIAMGRRTMDYRHVFTTPQTDASLVSAESRFGLNAAHRPLAPRLRDLGVGWVRFENMKWPFVSPAPQQYAFDGSVAPWHVNTDEIFETYRQNGLNILSYMFLTPAWASSAPADRKPDRVTTFPPRNPAWFGEFCFQTVARYGNTRHPPDSLLSQDKKSGLGLVHYFEMWNEPGLNPKPDATWGGWSASLDEYYEMMRFGAEAVRKADPTATVTSAGYAGIQVETVDRLRTYTYPDGKHPLEFVDVINVHYYSGRNPPETSTEDGNARVKNRTTFRQDLEELVAWRDSHAPGMPVWMTETGYDSGGPFGTSESVQAARLPRMVMLCLAFGVDKAFVYRESGSTPSMHACSGLLRDDFSEKPSWYTFGTLVREFAGVQGGAERLPHPDDRVWLLKWNAGEESLLTAWTVDDRVQLGIDLGECEVTDAFGARLKPGNSTRLELTPYPLYIRNMSNSAGWQDLLQARAREQEELEKLRERARARRKYLYDFGSTNRLGAHLLAGLKFPFQPVQAKEVWSQTRGYGFNMPAMSDENRAWNRSKLDGDGCRMHKDLQFRFCVDPGTYQLAIGFSAHADKADLLITGLKEPLTLPLNKKESLVETKLVVASPVILSVSHAGYGEIRWLTLVEDN